MKNAKPSSSLGADSLMSLFDRAFIINLPSRTDRRKRIESELRRIGLNINGRAQFFKAIRPADAGEFPSIGVRGCYLSHLGVLQEARRLGLQSVLVMEDDLVFARNFANLIPAAVEALTRTDWDMIYFGFEGLIEVGSGPIRRCDKPLTLAHFYGVREPGLTKLCDYLLSVLERPAGHPDGGPMYPDAAYNMFRKHYPSFATYIAVPVLGVQGPSPSDLAGYRWFDKVPLLRSIAALGRRVKLRTTIR